MRKGHIISKSFGWCDYHEKLLYLGRKAARQAARLHVDHKSTYPCDQNSGLYHVGGLAEPIMRGRLTRSEVYIRGA